MTDKERLELAAKAARIEWADGHESTGLRNANGTFWNPLTDDGDALRLAVKLKIDVVHTNIHSPHVHALADAKVQECEDSSGDPLAATRRAIVRAAAEIGKGMK